MVGVDEWTRFVVDLLKWEVHLLSLLFETRSMTVT